MIYCGLDVTHSLIIFIIFRMNIICIVTGRISGCLLHKLKYTIPTVETMYGVVADCSSKSEKL